MTISVIVATMNRAHELALMLPTLVAQSCLPEEVIVIDQSYDSSTKNLVEQHQADRKQRGLSKPVIVYVYEKDAAGAGAARNVGIERAVGDILVFLDDDVLLETEFLHEMIEAYRVDKSLGGVSGVVTNYARPGLVHRWFRRLFWTGPFHDERQPIYWSADELRNHPPIHVRKFASNVMSVKRSALGDDRFDDGGGSAFPVSEDVDLSWRLSERFPLVITPRARLVHLRTDNGRPRKHWLWSDSQGYYYLYNRHWRTQSAYRLCFLWLNIGYAGVATIASLRRRSLEPWRTLLAGARRGLQVGRRRSPRGESGVSSNSPPLPG